MFLSPWHTILAIYLYPRPTKLEGGPPNEVDVRVYWIHLVRPSELRLSADDGGGYCEFMLDNNGGGQL